MNNTFFDGLDELYHRAKFGEDRRTRTGCRCENVVFVTIFVCHGPRPERRAFEGCIVRISIALLFIRDVTAPSNWNGIRSFFARLFWTSCCCRLLKDYLFVVFCVVE